ncbi:MAG TPA: hypothetical protein VL749_12530 [Patescibacteria group bacterium]|nr:hypothetical protein [Patescibacteria group bacterium]
MQFARGLAIGLMALSSLTLAATAQPRPVLAADPEPQLSATLDGRPIPLEDVGKYNCDDFAYPEIRCWSTRVLADSRALAVTLLTSIDYVTIFDGTAFNGVLMNVSQDYAALSTIGWNDRVSSFKGRNSETGTFYADWFYSGTWYAFCCNSQIGNLGTFNNTFSSIIRT